MLDASGVLDEVTQQDIGSLLAQHRKRIGLSQGHIARELGYVNVNFISIIESGKSKIPMGRIDDFVQAYGLAPEFILVILRVLYPETLGLISRIANKVPKIFKDYLKNNDEELANIYLRQKGVQIEHGSNFLEISAANADTGC